MEQADENKLEKAFLGLDKLARTGPEGAKAAGFVFTMIIGAVAIGTAERLVKKLQERRRRQTIYFDRQDAYQLKDPFFD